MHFEIESASDDKHTSHRYTVIEVGQEIDDSYQIRDDNFDAIKALNKSVADGSCPVSQAFDVLVNYSILYKNIFGSAFLLKLLCILIISDENQKKLADWIAAIESFDKSYSDELAKFKAVTQRNRSDGHDVFDQIAKSFYSKHPQSIIPIDLLPLSQSFDVKPIGSDTMTSISDKIRHGIPMMKIDTSKEDTKSLEDFLKAHYFHLEEDDSKKA